jgi:hypothetical protein
VSNVQLDRWTSWARAISARHERFLMRRGLLVMTLLEPLRIFSSINQRLESFAAAVYPRIQISIGPIVQQLGREEFHSLFRSSTILLVANQHDWRSLPAPVRFVSLSNQTNQTVNLNNNTTLNLNESNSVTEERRTLNNLMQSPVARFFARTQHSHHGVVLLKNLLVERGSQAIAERVVREHSRVEQRRQRELVIRKQNLAAAALDTRQNALQQPFASTKTQTHPWADSSGRDRSLEINVEQLTEQVIRRIDHRITAYRERLGRAF